MELLHVTLPTLLLGDTADLGVASDGQTHPLVGMAMLSRCGVRATRAGLVERSGLGPVTTSFSRRKAYGLIRATTLNSCRPISAQSPGSESGVRLTPRRRSSTWDVD